MRVSGQHQALLLYPRKGPLYPLQRRVFGPQVRSGRMWKICSPFFVTEFEFPTVQSVGCRCTDCAIPPTPPPTLYEYIRSLFDDLRIVSLLVSEQLADDFCPLPTRILFLQGMSCNCALAFLSRQQVESVLSAIHSSAGLCVAQCIQRNLQQQERGSNYPKLFRLKYWACLLCDGGAERLGSTCLDRRAHLSTPVVQLSSPSPYCCEYRILGVIHFRDYLPCRRQSNCLT